MKLTTLKECLRLRSTGQFSLVAVASTVCYRDSFYTSMTSFSLGSKRCVSREVKNAGLLASENKVLRIITYMVVM
jgi:hypothetical protein